ncbi:MAG: hypothetical protein LQ344_001544 [Seirophora lacunosa]|nr:MAG: hypothetical protein LQ344_001544 [Seirophora lacunosa]
MSGVNDLSYEPLDMTALDRAEQLIQQLYQPGSPHQISEIQEDLQQLQRSSLGWQLADRLLKSEDEKVRFFGALTFTIKINVDWHTLEEQDTGPLLHRLLHWLTLRVNAQEAPLVTRKLCSSLVAYFLRPTVSWDRCLLHLVCCLNAGDAVNYGQLMSSPDKDVTRVVPNLGKTQLLASIWFALNLVEEVSKTSSTDHRTHKYHERMIVMLEDVVGLLQSSLQLQGNSDAGIAAESMKCFQVTADCLGDILSPFSAFFTTRDLDMLVGFLVSQEARYQLSWLHDGMSEPEPMAIARLLLAYGDASIQDLARNLNNTTVQLVMRELMQLLACTGYAGAEDDICTPALEFWQSYTEFLIDSLYGEEAEVRRWIDDAKQYVVQVIEKCWVKVRLPPEETWAGWNYDEKGDFKAFRAEVTDLLQSSHTLLGTSVFDRLAQLALEALQNHAWLHLEATLFCLNALAETISDEDVVDATLSRLYGSALFPQMMDESLAVPSKTQQTAVTTIVSFAAFVERHTEFLPPMLTFLFGSLQMPKLAGVAAKAIYSTCDTCRKCLVSEVGAFLSQYEALLQWEGVESATKEKVIGAIAAIVQAIPSIEHRVENFNKLLDFIEVDVEACLESAKVGLLEGGKETGLCALRCLVEMGKSMQEADGAVVDLENEDSAEDAHRSLTWALSQERIVHCLYAVSASLGGDGEVVEACCQLLRTGYKESSPGPFVFSPKITETFVANSNIQTPRLDKILDTASAMLTRHTRTAATAVDTSVITLLKIPKSRPAALTL